MTELTGDELERIFDFLELKRGQKLGCWICGGNEWAARKTRRVESDDDGHEMLVPYAQLICKNCKAVADFTNRVLEGP